MKEKPLDKIDELNVFLVGARLKPASETEFFIPTSLDFEQERQKIKDIRDYFSSFPVFFKEVLGYSFYGNVKSKKFYIGTDENKLKRLETAVVEKSDYQMGIAFGYPEEAVQMFEKIGYDGEGRDFMYVLKNVKRAIEHAKIVPSWLAYISWIPEQLDIVNGNVSESSKNLGEKYKDFTRTNNPKLAKDVEEEFYKKVVNYIYPRFRRFPDAYVYSEKSDIPIAMRNN